jgi:5-methylcytosine-specific restriction endonuclease McrA
MDELLARYRALNSNLPIHAIELHATWEGKTKPLIEFLSTRYKPYVSNSTQSRLPNWNLGQLKEALHRRARHLEHPSITSERLITAIEELHTHIRSVSRYQLMGRDLLRRCEEKCPHDPCFLGIWRNYEWIDLVLYHLQENVPWTDIDFEQFFQGNRQRAAIPAPVRRRVWAKHNTQDPGTCYVCDAPLEFANMECGHDIPHCLGGPTTLENLWPICRSCNRDMGVMRLSDYRTNVRAMMQSSSD